MPASPSQPTAEGESDDPLRVLVKTSYSWATPESIETSGSARAPLESMLGGYDAGLPGGLGLDGAEAAAAAAIAPAVGPRTPADLARGAGPRVVAGRVDHDRGAADRNDVGRGGRIIHGNLVTAVAVGSAIARSGEEGDARAL